MTTTDVDMTRVVQDALTNGGTYEGDRARRVSRALAAICCHPDVQEYDELDAGRAALATIEAYGPGQSPAERSQEFAREQLAQLLGSTVLVDTDPESMHDWDHSGVVPVHSEACPCSLIGDED